MNEEQPHPQDESGAAPEPEATSAAATTGDNKDDRNLAMLAHLLGIFTGFLGCLIIWLIKKDSSTFIDDQGKEALNFQITVLIGYLIGGVSTFIIIGCFIVPAVMIINIIFCILGALAASKGERYRYPLCLRLLK